MSHTLDAALRDDMEEDMAEYAYSIREAEIRLRKLSAKELRVLARHYFGEPGGGKDDLVRDLAEMIVEEGR